VTHIPSGEKTTGTNTISLKTQFEQLQSSEQGLASDEACKRLGTYGPNDTIGTKRASGLVQFLRLFLNPLIIILLIASIISAILGDPVDAGIIFVIVLLSNILNFVQTYRSQKAVDQLRSSVAPTATALRDGKWIEIQSRDLVPGDMIRLTAGDMVPADARLVQTTDLQVQQATLTARPPRTEFERGMVGFSQLIVRTVFFLVLFISLVGILGHHQPLETILFAISLAVGLTPEGLPAITTITLAQGAQNMAKQKVIVKYLESIENFGSIDTFCSDKTGTLTSGETQLEGHLDLSNHASDRVLLFGYLNSSFETGIKSPLDEAILKYKSVDTSRYSKVGEIPFDFERRRRGRTFMAPSIAWMKPSKTITKYLYCGLENTSR
jgi:P-type Mg2+ transporter